MFMDTASEKEFAEMTYRMKLLCFHKMCEINKKSSCETVLRRTGLKNIIQRKNNTVYLAVDIQELLLSNREVNIRVHQRHCAIFKNPNTLFFENEKHSHAIEVFILIHNENIYQAKIAEFQNIYVQNME